MRYKVNLYRIIAQTNLHVGSGEQTYGVIDNLVQRDVLTHLPTIHSSSLKGALREFFTVHYTENDSSQLINYVFGKDSTEQDQNNQAGHYRFFQAHLLSMPIRSNQVPFMRVSAPKLVKELRQFIHNLDVSFDTELNQDLAKIEAMDNGEESFIYHSETTLQNKEVILEDFSRIARYKSLGLGKSGNDFLGNYLACVDIKTLQELTDDLHLPCDC